jgi:hypothetical protein
LCFFLFFSCSHPLKGRVTESKHLTVNRASYRLNRLNRLKRQPDTFKLKIRVPTSCLFVCSHPLWGLWLQRQPGTPSNPELRSYGKPCFPPPSCLYHTLFSIRNLP